MTHILVIEDDSVIRGNLSELLELEGYGVSQAEDGVSGVQRALEAPPDLIICDVMMPNLDGYGVLVELRQHPATATIPFIFLTAKADKTDRREGMGLGADDYLTKPFTSGEVLSAVGVRLKRRAVLVEQYEDKLAGLRDSISLSMPHELRTPLTGILSMSSVLLDSFDLLSPEELRSGLNSIHVSAERLTRLVMNYLAYAELEVALADPARRAVAAAGLTPSAQMVLTDAAIERAQSLQRAADLIFSVHDMPVRVAPAHLAKIVEELVDNACKFSAAGMPIEVGGRQIAGRYELTILDHGRGMTAEQIADIGAYMQFDRKLHEQQGSGLGLTVVKRLVDLYHGAVVIESIYGSQTAVRVSLPV